MSDSPKKQTPKHKIQPAADENNMREVKRKLLHPRSLLARNPLVVLGNFFLMFFVFIVIAMIIFFFVYKNMFVSAGPSETEQVVFIQSGTGIRQIGNILEKQGLIRDSDVFFYNVGFNNKAKQLKAGEYLIPAHASMQDIMNILVNGKSLEYTFTVPEGLTVANIYDRLNANEILVGDLPKEMPAEGSLMTDTVSFVRGTTRAQVLEWLRVGQAKLVNDIWENRDPAIPLTSINEMVTLASIVEKETGIVSERPQVAAVFYNRLAKKMRLQSDPTFLYGLFGGKGKPSGRPILQSDIDSFSPYNTYKIYGLPPTPIANPGRDALLAVAHPPKTDDLYFVADGKGGHVFSKTLAEHNANVAKYRALTKNK